MDGPCDLSRGRDSEKIGPIFISTSFVNATDGSLVVVLHGLTDYWGDRRERFFFLLLATLVEDDDLTRLIWYQAFINNI